MKELEGRPITVRVTGQTTLFVTNFPPSADELYIRELFSKVRLHNLVKLLQLLIIR